MNTKLFTTLTAATALLLTTQVPARASGFNFVSNVTQANGAAGDITLNSITQGSKTIDAKDLSYVKAVDIIYNTKIDPSQGTSGTPGASNNNTGAASTDKGDKATSPLLNGSPLNPSGVKDPTGAEMAAYLGNNNLNNIIDTEDSGKFTLNVWFTKAVASILLWERGMNSRISVQAINSTGQVIGNLLKLDSSTWQYAGYDIDTTEIGGAQKVGSIGISLADLGLTDAIAGIQLSTDGSKGDNGPDFKVAGEAASVPEPLTMGGLALGVSGMIAARRRQTHKTA